MISVIIPFYQRTPGLLLRAVGSILNQTADVPRQIIVVDDDSPISAESELAPLRSALGGSLTLIRQSNQGAAAARNRGLDFLRGTSGFVAFLDSDDTWQVGHLDRIAASAEAGADFYFENYHKFDSPAPRFSDADMNSRTHPLFDQARELHWFDGDFFDLLFRCSPVATPAVAYNFDLMPDIRFRTDLWFCEDIFFWMEASRIARKIAFSRIVGVSCGQGVNISRGVWGTFMDARRTLGQTRYQTLVEGRFNLTDGQTQSNWSMLRGLDVDFWQSVMAATLRGELRCASLVLSYLKLRPQAVARIPSALTNAIKSKLPKRAA